MTIIYLLLAILGLGLLVFIHELGHYIVAKKTGMIVEVFSIGFGRPLIKWKWQQVDWQIGWLPFGGYVKILGMEVSEQNNCEPYEIPHGFFAQAPWKRICVALAGPIANFLLAVVVFCLLWGIGGRVKPFSEYTQIVGWVDPASKIYEMGLRPGDKLLTYNGQRFTGAKDLLYAAMLNGQAVTLEGERIDYLKATMTPFRTTVTPYLLAGGKDGIETTGISAMARYLVYEAAADGTSLLAEGSPMVSSGIEGGDRLVWADGELLFSMEQLSALANGTHALLTIQRGETTLLSRQPRVLASDVHLPSHVKDELEDWRYEQGLISKLPGTYVLPYIVNTDGYVEGSLSFIDTRSQEIAFPKFAYSKELQRPLELGDRILAVDGQPVTKGPEILKLLQTHHVQIIAQRGLKQPMQSWKVEDQAFFAAWNVGQIMAVAQGVGKVAPLTAQGPYVLLRPVEPKAWVDFAMQAQTKEKLEASYNEQVKQAEAIKNIAEREQALNVLQAYRAKKLLGAPLQDCYVRYNPNPFVLFGSVFTETWHTLAALVKGNLHPKWLSGPVGIVRVMHHGWRVGFGEALFWIGAISLNLGFLNLLPIPVLDGGHIVLSLWEWITKRRIKAKTMKKIILPFVVLLIAFFVFLVFQDVLRLF